MPIENINKHRCHFIFENEGHEKTILLSNSLGCILSMWEEQLEYLLGHANVVRYDTRGHGRSETTPGEYTMELLAKDVLALADHLGLKKFSFCGLSMGGQIGQWLALNAPHRLESLVLANTAAKIGTTNGWNDRIKKVLDEGMESLMAGCRSRWFSPEFNQNHPIKVTEFIRNNLLQVSAEGYAANCAAVRDADFRKDLHKITVPTLILSGLHDKATTVADGDYLQQKMGNTSHIKLDTSHLSNIEKGREFAAHILFHLKH